MAKTTTQQSNQDAISLLTEDHKKVKKLFAEFEALKESEGSDDEKAELVSQICMEITIHAQVEEEIFYPAVRQAIDDDDLMDEAEEEHAEVKELISQLESMEPFEDHYDAKVKVMSENIEHHAKEEEDEMFPAAKKAKVDTLALGAEMARRKKQLQTATPPKKSSIKA